MVAKIVKLRENFSYFFTGNNLHRSFCKVKSPIICSLGGKLMLTLDDFKNDMDMKEGVNRPLQQSHQPRRRLFEYCQGDQMKPRHRCHQQEQLRGQLRVLPE